MPIDWGRAAERAQELAEAGYTPSQINAVLDQEQAQQDAQAQQYGHESAAASRSSLQQARSSLNAEGMSPGQEPTSDPYEDAFAAARRAGPRGSQQAFQAGIEKIFEAAQAGDPRVMTQGTVDAKTREAWIEQAHERQATNRERSGWTHR